MVNETEAEMTFLIMTVGVLSGLIRPCSMAGGEKDGAPETYDATIEARKKQRIRIQKIKEKKQAKKAVEDVKIETDVHETLATLDEAELKLKNSNRESEAPSRLRNSEITDTTS